jgi:protein O-mannosyl-transferase
VIGSARRQWPSLAVALLACAAAAPSLGNRFAYDDDSIVVDNPAVHSLAGVVRAFGSSYWPATLGGALYRPLATALFALQWTLGHGAPIVFHAVNVILYVVVCVLVLGLARRLMPEGWAVIAAALFAVHPVHVEVVANVVGQSELLVTVIAVLCVTRYLDGRRAILPLCALYALGLLTKEHAAVIPALFVAAELTVIDDDRPWRARVAAARPLAAALGLTLVAYIGVRMVVLGPSIGESTLIPLVRAPWTTRWWTTLGIVPEWLRLLVWPAHLVATYAPPEVAIRTAPDAQALAGLAIVLVAVVACAVARRRLPVPVFGVMWTAIALLPVSNLLVPSGVLLAERSLFLPSVGAMMVVGVLAPVRVAWPVAVVAGLIVMAGLGCSALRAPVWRDDATLWAVSAAESPHNYFTHYQYGTELFREGRPEAAERELRTAIALEPEDPRLYTSLGWRLTAANRCDTAAPLFRNALALWPMSYEARAGLVTCLMRAGDYAGARSLAMVAVAHGGHQAFFVRVIAAADSALPTSARRH